MKLTITQLGQPKVVSTKFGNREKSYIKAQEYGDNYLSHWVSQDTKAWAVGQVIEAEVKTREYNGKTYYDLVLPKRGFNNEKIDKIYDLMLVMVEEHKKMKEYFVAKFGVVEPKKDDNYPVNDLDGVPFE
jgi:hypothetical protein